MLIGASIGQVPLLQRAKSKGIHVTVATIPGKYPCIPMADDVIYKDIYDRDGIVAVDQSFRDTKSELSGTNNGNIHNQSPHGSGNNKYFRPETSFLQ